MNKVLTLVGLLAVLAFGCDTAPSTSNQESANATTVTSLSPENKAVAVYSVSGMT
jgi:hypothetical protein